LPSLTFTADTLPFESEKALVEACFLLSLKSCRSAVELVASGHANVSCVTVAESLDLSRDVTDTGDPLPAPLDSSSGIRMLLLNSTVFSMARISRRRNLRPVRD